MSYYLKIALKYLKSDNHKGIAAGNLISILGIFLGVFSLIVVMSVMNGFDYDLTNRIIGVHSEIKIFSNDYQQFSGWEKIKDKIKYLAGVYSITPICRTEAMLMNNNNVSGTVCFGIELESFQQSTDLLQKIFIGSQNSDELENNGIIIGSDLAGQLRANLGDEIILSSPIATEYTPFGPIPKTRKFKIIGIFVTGLPQYDLKYSYISLKNAQEFLDWKDEVSYIEIKTTNPNLSLKIAKTIKRTLSTDWQVLDWSEFEKHLFSAIKFEKLVMFLVLCMIFLIATFNMIGNFIKLVIEKKFDIGILKTLGATSLDIKKVFFINSTIISMIGTATGLFASLTLLMCQIKWQFVKLPIQGMPFQAVPVKIELLDIILVIIISISISLLSGIIPATRAAKYNIINIIRDKEE
ncbi:MAG: hypothetical protein DRH57_08480 [Candidatus Cloacimonadota bacterium]|nr:MAG: hypothetical protein DRH57_08480 [Candidatus Cloacimonadota bacterium]